MHFFSLLTDEKPTAQSNECLPRVKPTFSQQICHQNTDMKTIPKSKPKGKRKRFALIPLSPDTWTRTGLPPLDLQSGGIDKKKKNTGKLEQEAAEVGRGSLKYVWVSDTPKVECGDGITIDTPL